MPPKELKRPEFTESEAAQLAQALYGVAGDITELTSYIDQNFLIRDTSGARYVLKIANTHEPPDELDLQTQAMQYLVAHHTRELYPNVCKTKSGEVAATIESKTGARHIVRMLTYLPGKPLAQVKPHSPGLLHGLGVFLGEMDKTLAGFDHPARRDDFRWSFHNAAATTRAHIDYIHDAQRRGLVEKHLGQFEALVTPVIHELRAHFVHHDANDYNVLAQTC